MVISDNRNLVNATKTGSSISDFQYKKKNFLWPLIISFRILKKGEVYIKNQAKLIFLQGQSHILILNHLTQRWKKNKNSINAMHSGILNFPQNQIYNTKKKKLNHVLLCPGRTTYKLVYTKHTNEHLTNLLCTNFLITLTWLEFSVESNLRNKCLFLSYIFSWSFVIITIVASCLLSRVFLSGLFTSNTWKIVSLFLYVKYDQTFCLQKLCQW